MKKKKKKKGTDLFFDLFFIFSASSASLACQGPVIQPDDRVSQKFPAQIFYLLLIVHAGLPL